MSSDLPTPSQLLRPKLSVSSLAILSSAPTSSLSEHLNLSYLHPGPLSPGFVQVPPAGLFREALHSALGASSTQQHDGYSAVQPVEPSDSLKIEAKVLTMAHEAPPTGPCSPLVTGYSPNSPDTSAPGPAPPTSSPVCSRFILTSLLTVATPAQPQPSPPQQSIPANTGAEGHFTDVSCDLSPRDSQHCESREFPLVCSLLSPLEESTQ